MYNGVSLQTTIWMRGVKLSWRWAGALNLFSPDFDPELGTLNEILSMNKMDIIENKPLRKPISIWNKYMDELSEVDEKLEHFDLQVKEPYYSKQIPFKNAISPYVNFLRE